MRFWDTKIGKILSHVIHEHNTGIAYLNNIEFYIDRNDPEKAKMWLERGKKKLKESSDYMYNKIKEETWEEH